MSWSSTAKMPRNRPWSQHGPHQDPPRCRWKVPTFIRCWPTSKSGASVLASPRRPFGPRRSLGPPPTFLDDVSLVNVKYVRSRVLRLGTAASHNLPITYESLRSCHCPLLPTAGVGGTLTFRQSLTRVGWEHT